MDLYCQGTWVSMGVYSDGSYNVPAGLMYSFPVTCCGGEWKIVQGTGWKFNPLTLTLLFKSVPSFCNCERKHWPCIFLVLLLLSSLTVPQKLSRSCRASYRWVFEEEDGPHCSRAHWGEGSCLLLPLVRCSFFMLSAHLCSVWAVRDCCQ